MEPGAPGQVPKEKGVPKTQGVPRERALLPGQGKPPEQGVPKAAAVLPGTPGRKLPGAEGQRLPGTPGQLHKHAENPWAPTPDTVIVDEADMLVPPSRPPEPPAR